VDESKIKVDSPDFPVNGSIQVMQQPVPEALELYVAKGGCPSDIPSNSPASPSAYLYGYDSYDQTALLSDPQGQRLNDRTRARLPDLAYSVDWTGALTRERHQEPIKYPNAPP